MQVGTGKSILNGIAIGKHEGAFNYVLKLKSVCFYGIK